MRILYSGKYNRIDILYEWPIELPTVPQTQILNNLTILVATLVLTLSR